jgi:hypothetical protein
MRIEEAGTGAAAARGEAPEQCLEICGEQKKIGGYRFRRFFENFKKIWCTLLKLG